MRVVVTGAGGYIGSRLVPRLLADGHEVVVTFTDPGRAKDFWWAPDVQVRGLNAMHPQAVRRAIRGADAVVYLVHGLAGDDYSWSDRVAATTMAVACTAESVERIVYLGGIIPDVNLPQLSTHLRSRLEVEDALRSSTARLVALRAAAIIGAGSTSFEIIRQISERLPLHLTPRWMSSYVQPIAVTDVTAAIAAALLAADPDECYDVAGTERLRYRDLLRRYARAAALTRPQVGVPALPLGIAGRLAATITDAPEPTVRALIHSLRHDMVAADDRFATELLPPRHRLVGLDEALSRALATYDDGVPAQQRDPMGPMPHDASWTGGQGGGLASGVAALGAIATSVARLLGRY